jgi:esterase/lipase superfamily enzyme
MSTKQLLLLGALLNYALLGHAAAQSGAHGGPQEAIQQFVTEIVTLGLAEIQLSNAVNSQPHVEERERERALADLSISSQTRMNSEVTILAGAMGLYVPRAPDRIQQARLRQFQGGGFAFGNNYVMELATLDCKMRAASLNARSIARQPQNKDLIQLIEKVDSGLQERAKVIGTHDLPNDCAYTPLELLEPCCLGIGMGYEAVPFAKVTVFFATNRNRTQSLNPAREFGSERANLSYGTAAVSIPHDHRMGYLESPAVFSFRSADPAKDVLVLSISHLRQNVFLANLKQLISADSGNRSALVFVHGYNVSFEDAARRTAQMTYDLDFRGFPIFFSWPSKAKRSAYPVDENTIAWSQEDLRSLLDSLASETEVENIYLIAHSMGSRAVVGAFKELISEKPQLRPRFKEIVLTAPDIDADTLTRDMPKLVGAGEARTAITLYASSNDKALRASKLFHGERRAGDTDGGVVVFPGLETIDATAVETGLVGHSYFGESKSVLADIFSLIRDRERACNRFGLRPVRSDVGKLCRFAP